MKLLTIGLVVLGAVYAGCSAETAPAPTDSAEKTESVSEPLLGDPLECYAKCIDRGGTPAGCDTSCGCNGSCNPNMGD
jgi:hypothetical protein